MKKKLNGSDKPVMALISEKVLKRYMSELGRKGNKARNKKLSKSERIELATKASHSRPSYKAKNKLFFH